MSGDPLAALRALCRDGAGRAHDPLLRDELVAIGRQLDRPLQLAVAGAVSAGKSTLINAMLRRPVAPADAGECTRLVTWYEHGTGAAAGTVLVEGTDGSTRRLALVGGRVPDALGVDPAVVLRLRVLLDEPVLRTVTVIDTPGVNTVSAENEEATRRLLFGDAAAEHAQALVYVLRYVQRFDADTLEEFRALSAACGMTAVNTAAVLTQIDRRGDDEDPWPTARRLVATASAALGGRVLDVAPVIGLLAETARGGLLGAAEVAGLRELAALPVEELADLLLDLDEFTGDEFGGEAFGPVDLPVRRVLVERLHRYGIQQAVARLRERPDTRPGELHRWLAGRSGYGADVAPDGATTVWDPSEQGPEVSRSVSDVLERFARHAGRLKAFAAVGRIRELARRSADPRDGELRASLRDAVDETRPVAAGLRGLRILAACAALGRGQLRIDESMTAELMRLARYDDPAAGLGLPPTSTAADLLAAAADASRRWRRVVQLAGPTVGGQRARDVLGVLEDMAAAAQAVAGAAGGARSSGPAGGAPGDGDARRGIGAAAGPGRGTGPPAGAQFDDDARPGIVVAGGRDVSGGTDHRTASSGGTHPPVAHPPAAHSAAQDGPASVPGPAAPHSPAPHSPAPHDSAAVHDLGALRGRTGSPVAARDRPTLERLVRSAELAAADRAVVAALLAGRDARSAVGADSPEDTARLAAELALRFRVLLQRPLPVADRRGVQAACAAFETIVAGSIGAGSIGAGSIGAGSIGAGEGQ